MTHTRKPANHFCTRVSRSSLALVSAALNKISSYYYGNTAPYAHIPHYSDMTTADCLLSERAQNSEEFSKQVFAATALALKHPSRKCTMTIGTTRALVICDPKDIVDIFKKNDKNLNSDESVSLFGRHFSLGKIKNIMAIPSADPEWRPIRNHFTTMLFENPALSKITKVMQHTLDEYFDNIMKEKTQKINLEELANKFTLDMVLKGLLHAEKISEDAKLRLAKLIEKGVDQAVKINNVAWMAISDVIEQASCHKVKLTLESDKLTKAGEQLVKNEIITPNIKSLQNDETSWLTVKMKYAQEQLGVTLAIDSDELLKETTFLLTAGHDTTAKHFMFSFLLICKHPHVLNKVIAEVKSLNKAPKDWTDDDFKKMTYLDLITLESLRICPPLPIQKTKVAKEFTTRDGITLKPGDQVFANIGATHRLPNIYNKPDEFIPERFTDQKFDQFVFQTVDPSSPYYFAWMPFGSGARSCPGRRAAMQEVKIALAYFAYFVNMKLEKDWSLHEVMTTFGARPHTENPIELVITSSISKDFPDEKNSLSLRKI